jgi:hypothetical protein
MKRSSLYIQTEGPNQQAVDIGFHWLVQTGVKKNSSIMLAVIQKSILDRVLPTPIENSLKHFKKHEKLTISIGQANLQLGLLTTTQRTTAYNWTGAVLAIYPDKKLLDTIDDISGITDVLIVPHNMSEVQYWIDTWEADEIAGKSSAVEKVAINPIVREALRTLSSNVNLSTGIGHPMDKIKTIALFRRLQMGNIPLDADGVRAWLVRYGKWKPEDADDVREIVIKILSGRHFQNEQTYWNENILETWKERAQPENGDKT